MRPPGLELLDPAVAAAVAEAPRAPLKLHLGCGGALKPGYINVDMRTDLPNDMQADCCALPFANDTAELVEANHLIEHLGRHDAERALREWNRVLRPGGRLIIECPNVREVAREFVLGRDERLDNIYGLQRGPGDTHLFGYTPESLADLLRRHGFERITQRKPETYHLEPSFRTECVKTHRPGAEAEAWVSLDTLDWVNVEPTNRCQLRCPYCGDRRVRRRGLMSPALLSCIVQQMPRAVEVRLFLSGEPLLHPHLDELIRIVRERMRKVMIHTNAVALSESWAHRLIESGLTHISFSIDGLTKEEYEASRVGADFDKVIANVQRFLAINRGRVHSTVQMIRTHPKNLHVERELEALLPNAHRYYIRYPHSWDEADCAAGAVPDRGGATCVFPFNSLSIQWDGKAVACCADLNGRYIVGDAASESLEEILNGPKLRSLRRRMLEKKPIPELCDGCERYQPHRAPAAAAPPTEVCVTVDRTPERVLVPFCARDQVVADAARRAAAFFGHDAVTLLVPAHKAKAARDLLPDLDRYVLATGGIMNAESVTAADARRLSERGFTTAVIPTMDGGTDGYRNIELVCRSAGVEAVLYLGPDGRVEVEDLAAWPYPVDLEALRSGSHRRRRPKRSHRASYPREATIIIPSHNDLHMLKRCVETLRAHTHFPYRVIIVNDGGDETVTRFLARLERRWDGLRVITMRGNHGFCPSANVGLAEVTTAYAVLLNSDAFVPDGWLGRMVECMESDPAIALATPFSNSGQATSIALEPGLSFAEMDAACRALDGPPPDIDAAVGFCMMIRTAAMDRLGMLDEVFAPMYGEETDLHMHYVSHGYRSVLAHTCYVYHAQRQSVTPQRETPLRARGMRLLSYRWGPVLFDRFFTRERALRPVREQVRAHLHATNDAAPRTAIAVSATSSVEEVTAAANLVNALVDRGRHAFLLRLGSVEVPVPMSSGTVTAFSAAEAVSALPADTTRVFIACTDAHAKLHDALAGSAAQVRPLPITAAVDPDLFYPRGTRDGTVPMHVVLDATHLGDREAAVLASVAAKLWDEYDTLIRLHAIGGLPERVEGVPIATLSALEYRRRPELLSQADVFISLRKAGGTIGLEALACGCVPLVRGGKSGWRHALAEVGCEVPTLSAQVGVRGVVERATRILEDRALRRAVAKAGPRIAVKHTWIRACDALAE